VYPAQTPEAAIKPEPAAPQAVEVAALPVTLHRRRKEAARKKWLKLIFITPVA